MTSRGAPPSSGSSDRRQELERAIANEEAGLRRLEAEQAEAHVRLSVLRSELAALDLVPAPAPAQTVSAQVAPLTAGPHTPADKVKLFRQLFRGRPDIYPTRFVSNKTGKPGYAPACSNKFVRGVCELPKVKCGDCTRQAFRPVDDAAVVAHLKGQHVMGVYAMLDDETCWFLAIDFDKSTWEEDVRAVADTARRIGLPVVIERSRSGNGAHVWFFFSAPVAATTARKMGCHLITETMARRHELSMDSYDRLFPSQDTMPRGGFGSTRHLDEARDRNQDRDHCPRPRNLTDHLLKPLHVPSPPRLVLRPRPRFASSVDSAAAETPLACRLFVPDQRRLDPAGSDNQAMEDRPDRRSRRGGSLPEADPLALHNNGIFQNSRPLDAR
jgi:hypothetical protein